MRTKKKNDSVLTQFSETITARYGKAEEILLDTGRVHYSYRPLEEVVNAANELEGANFIEVKCGPLCPERRS